MIDVQHISLAYSGAGEGPVLENLTFSAKPGEKIALVGANGAGKSTLLLSLVGIIPVLSGAILIDGIPVGPKTLSAVRRRAGLVFQNPDDQLFMPTVWDDLLFGPRSYAAQTPRREADGSASLSLIEERGEKLLERFGIAALKNRISHKLSGGEKRLAALAGVLIMEPGVLLLDEPTAFLDPKSRRGLIAHLQELPQTMLIATHDIDFASRLCSRAILLAGKTLFASGPAETLLADAALLERAGL